MWKNTWYIHISICRLIDRVKRSKENANRWHQRRRAWYELVDLHNREGKTPTSKSEMKGIKRKKNRYIPSTRLVHPEKKYCLIDACDFILTSHPFVQFNPNVIGDTVYILFCKYCMWVYKMKFFNAWQFFSILFGKLSRNVYIEILYAVLFLFSYRYYLGNS